MERSNIFAEVFHSIRFKVNKDWLLVMSDLFF